MKSFLKVIVITVVMYCVVYTACCIVSQTETNKIIAQGSGTIEYTGGSVRTGLWSLFKDGTVAITANLPESWVLVTTNPDSVPPDVKRPLPRNFELYRSTAGTYMVIETSNEKLDNHSQGGDAGPSGHPQGTVRRSKR